MIRFLSDTKRYPGMVYDTTTSNESFLKIAKRYQTMGLSNYAFCLTLLNPNLKGVDPHDPNLTFEQKNAIRVECQWNIWYFLREVARVVGQGGEDTPFLANRGNISAAWLFLTHNDFTLIQPRQTGKSIIADFIHIWVLLFAGRNTFINMITLNDSLRVKNILRIKKAIKLLPPYLRSLKGEVDNTQIVSYSALNNYLYTYINSDSKDKARETARGQSGPINHGDEYAYWKWIEETFAGALGSSGAAVENAKASGNPYGNFFTTTAGMKDDRHGRIAYDYVNKGAVWSEAYFDAKNEFELQRMLEAAHHPAARKYMVNATFSYLQLGYTHEWATALAKRHGLSADDIQRDLLNIWTSGSSAGAISKYLSERIVKSVRTPLYVETFDEPYFIRWFIPKDKIGAFLQSHQCVWGMDTSTANGKDAMTLVLREVETLRTVAVCSVTESFIVNYAKWFAKVLVKYPNTTLVIERASTAETIIETLIIELTKNNVNPFTRIYNKIVSQREKGDKELERVLNPRNLHNMAMYQEHLSKGSFGFIMNKDSRETVYSEILQTSVQISADHVQDEILAKEIVGLEIKNNRVDHASGGHDDHVISWLLPHWFLAKTRNLSRYGIEPSLVMRRCSLIEDNREKEKVPVIETLKKRRVKAEIEEVTKQLGTVTNTMHIATLERKLRHLANTYSQSDSEIIGVDGLIEKARQERRRMQLTAGGVNDDIVDMVA